MSLRDQILATKDIPSEIVNIPEWNVDIEVRGMTGSDRTRILETAVDTKTGTVNLKVVYPEIIIASAHDPKTGERIFNEDDRDAILTKSANALDRVAEVGMRLGGFSKEETDATAKSFPDGESA